MTFLYLFGIAIFTPTAWTVLIVSPQNVTVEVNQSTFLNCSTTSEKGVKWLHEEVMICAGLDCYEPYKQRFRVENNTSTGAWNLILSYVKFEDSGDYKCEEIEFSADWRSAHLTVLKMELKETTVVLLQAAPVADAPSVSATGGIIAAIICTVGILILIVIIVFARKFWCKRREASQTNEIETNEEEKLIRHEVYFDQPILVKTIETRMAKKSNSSIRAVSVFKDEVFVATDNCPEVEVFDSLKLDLIRDFTIDILINPLDIKSCLLNDCLYIFDCEYIGQPGKILKIDFKGEVLANWPMDDSGARLSVASNGNVIVSLSTSEKVVEYMADGTKHREIKVRGLCHAIQLNSKQFLISQGYLDQSELHRVCQLVLEDGVTNAEVGTGSVSIINAYGGEKGSGAGQMNVPWYIAMDENGCIFVAERENRRVTLLRPTCKFKKILISEDHLQRPLNLFMDIPNGRLFVTDYILRGTDRADGRLLVFKIR